jgi:hypothetical protein
MSVAVPPVHVPGVTVIDFPTTGATRFGVAFVMRSIDVTTTSEERTGGDVTKAVEAVKRLTVIVPVGPFFFCSR